MEFDSLIKKRKSVRSFKKKKASWEDILEAIDTANQGPFADNINNLKFLIVEDEESIKKIAEISEQLWINESGILVVVCSDEQDIENMHDERGRIYSRQQAGASIMSFLLKITDLCLASCWVGSYDEDEIRRVLKIPKNINIEAILPVGYEKDQELKPKKKAIENTIYWEKWMSSKRPEFFVEQKDARSVKG